MTVECISLGAQAEGSYRVAIAALSSAISRTEVVVLLSAYVAFVQADLFPWIEDL